MEYHDHPDFFPSISAVTEEGPGPILLHFGGAVVTGPPVFLGPDVSAPVALVVSIAVDVPGALRSDGPHVRIDLRELRASCRGDGAVYDGAGRRDDPVVRLLPGISVENILFLAIYILTSLTMIGAYYLYYIHCVIYTQSLFALAEWTNVFNNIIFQYSLFRTCFTGTDYYRTLSGTFRELPV
eukprot:CAMPEP_0119123130 /NCGR_PEP_ID=MMETSP1310-20130426/3170_1 /TAXON_ID=464262 /ORGANISM="Genus nov. species nov., Strain RCC2339" /LENGTH=182 /DNA_ID=CAMNT_0007112883 /DNA_START=211 /DNA_END=759 /DNA_ORIENTATION=-